MGTDKALLRIGGRTAYAVALSALEPFCERVYLSCRPDQQSLFYHAHLLPDVLPSHGPMTGLLSAWRLLPEAAWLVLAVDMHLTTPEYIWSQLLAMRDTQCRAVVCADECHHVQPLCALYEPSARGSMEDAFTRRSYSLRQLLGDMQVQKLTLPAGYLQQWNTAQEWCAFQQETDQ